MNDTLKKQQFLRLLEETLVTNPNWVSDAAEVIQQVLEKKIEAKMDSQFLDQMR